MTEQEKRIEQIRAKCIKLAKERDKWKEEYENLCKFANDLERERDEARTEAERHWRILRATGWEHPTPHWKSGK